MLQTLSDPAISINPGIEPNLARDILESIQELRNELNCLKTNTQPTHHHSESNNESTSPPGSDVPPSVEQPAQVSSNEDSMNSYDESMDNILEDEHLNSNVPTIQLNQLRQ